MSHKLDETLYKARKIGEERMIQLPVNTQGYFRREVSRDGMTITYRKVT